MIVFRIDIWKQILLSYRTVDFGRRRLSGRLIRCELVRGINTSLLYFPSFYEIIYHELQNTSFSINYAKNSSFKENGAHIA